MKRAIKHIAIAIFIFGNSYLAHSQLVSFSGFSLIQNEKEVLLYWVIDSGYTCNGITIWRSSDSVNYSQVGEILGVCGSTSAPIPYQYSDQSPDLNRVNYYKIRMGLNQFSYVKHIYVDYVDPGTLFMKPNPATDKIDLELNADFYNDYSIMIYNSIGQRVFQKDNLNTKLNTIYLDTFDPGAYYVFVVDASGKKLSQKLIIKK